MSDGEDKSEQPSEMRLQEARKKGQVAKSADVVAFFGLFFTITFLILFFGHGIKRLTHLLLSISQSGFLKIDHQIVKNVSKNGLDLWFLLSLPLLAVSALGIILGHLCQFGFLLSAHPLKPDLSRIDPLKGFKKLCSKNRLMELFKQLLKFGAVSLVILFAIKDAFSKIIMLFRVDLSHALMVSHDLILSIVMRVLICFLLIAIVDFFWQRYSFLKSMRMSKYEVKKEYKQQEGDPHIKHERRRIHKETLETMAENRVEEAAVIITNPSHLAVALKYVEEKDDIPTVIAKGRGKSAKKIIDEAHRLKIPIMRNVPLARDLQWLDINEEIPKNLYDSVAEVLTFIHELNAKQS